jgi:hypothetical protein
MKKITAETEGVRELCEMYQSGNSLSDITAKTGLLRDQVAKRLRAGGITLRPRGSYPTPSGYISRIALSESVNKSPDYVAGLIKGMGIQVHGKFGHQLLTDQDAQKIREEVAKEYSLPATDSSCVPDWELGWLGGIIDGEGCLTITNSGGHWSAVVSVSSTTPAITRHVTSIWNRLGVKHTISDYPPKSENRSHVYRTEITGIKYQWICLKAVKPYLVLKGSDADIMLDFCVEWSKNAGSAKGKMKEIAKVYAERFRECRKNLSRGVY